MHTALKWAGMLCVCAAIVAIAAFSPQAVKLPSPHIKVLAGEGHGSGTHIGDGFYITAAHVVRDRGSVKLLNGAGLEISADVLWVNKEYDISMLKASETFVSSLHMTCHDPVVGERVTAYGNPFNYDFQMFRGYVAGAPKKMDPWKLAFTLDATVLPGISGGAVMDSNGDMIGVAVGVLGTGLGSFTGLGMAVPSSTVCMLMGRV